MRKMDRFLSVLLTAAMVLTLLDAPALGMYVSLTGDSASVSVGEGGAGFAAAYDEAGRMLGVGESAALTGDARALKVMEADGESYAPRTAPLTVELRDGAYSDLSVPEGSTLELTEPATLTGWNRVDGTLAIPQGSALTIAQDGELFIDDVTEGGQGKLALGGVIYAYGDLNVGSWNRRIDAYDGETSGKLYTAWDMNSFAAILGEFFEDSPVVARKSSWQTTPQGVAMRSRLNDEWNQNWAQSVIAGYDILRGCNALDLSRMREDNNYNPQLTEAMALDMLSAVWENVTEEAPVENFVVFDSVEDEACPDRTLFACELRVDGEDRHWEESFNNEVRATLRSCVSSLMSSASHLTIRGDGRGAYAETDEGLRSYDAVEGVTFPNHLTVTVDGSASNRFYTFNGCTFEQGVEVEVQNVRNVDLHIKDIRIPGAHIFGYESPYGVYTGMERGEFESNVTDFAVYPGRWNDERDEPEFPDAPAFTMSDTEQYEYNYNDENGVNINAKDNHWIEDPYQVKLVMTLANGVTLTYNTLWYKEGQMELAEFASRLRGRIDGALADVDDDDRAAVTERWQEHEYGDRLDDFAFAVKYGGLLRPNDEDDQGAEDYWVTHYWEAWNDLRYGTAKRILEGVYRAAWDDEEHTSLPDSVKLINDEGEWHREEDGFQHREIDRMISALLGVLPQSDNDATTLHVLRRADDGWMYVLLDDAEDTEDNRWDANLSGLRFAEPLTVVIDESARGEWLSFNNCTFEQGLTVEAPPVIQRENEQGETYYDIEFFHINFNDNCSGTIVVNEAEADKTARENMRGMLRSEIDGDRFDRLFYHGTIGLNGAAGLTVRTDARVCLSADGGAVTLNGVAYSSEAHFDLNTNHSEEWSWDEAAEEDRLVGESLRVYLTGEGYDEWDESSLDRRVTVSGVSESDIYLRGMADATGLTLGEGKRLIAEFDHGRWNNCYAILNEGQTLYVNDNDWRLDLYVNGERIERPRAEWDGRDMRIDAAKGCAASVWQWREEGLTDIGGELEFREEEYSDSFYNKEDGWNDEDGRWYPLNSDSIHGVQVRYDVGGVTVVYDSVPRCWDRAVSLHELGENMLYWLRENGREELAFDGFTAAEYLDHDAELDEASVALFNEIWRDGRFRDWSDAEDRAQVAFILRLLPDGIDERYSDPGDTIRYGDAKAVFAALLRKLGKDADEIGFDDHGWQDDWTLNQGGKNDLYDQFCDLLPRLAVEGDVELTLNRRSDGFTYYEWNGEAADTNEIIARDFLGKVTVRYGENAAEGDDWGGELYFRNCSLGPDFVVYSDEGMPFKMEFHDSCAGEVTVETNDYSRVELGGLRNLIVEADSGVSLNAREATGSAYLELRSHENYADVDGRRLHWAWVSDWDPYVVQMRLNDDFLSEEDVGLTLDGEALPFSFDGHWQDGGYEIILRGQDGEPWFNRDSLEALALTLPLSGAVVTLAPPSDFYDRPADVNYLVDRLLDMLGNWDYHVLDDSMREEYQEVWDDYLTCGMAKTILADAWRTLREDAEATLPESLALDGRDDSDILTNGEVSELVWERLQKEAFYPDFSGDTAAELQAALDSGSREVWLPRDLTLDGDLEIPRNVGLFVEKDATLTIPAGVTLTIRGTLVNIGTITGGGTIVTAEPDEGDNDNGLFINDFEDGAQAVVEGTAFVNNGAVLCCVNEDEKGMLVRQPYFDSLGGKVDFRAYVTTQKGFDTAAEEEYNQCVVMGDGIECRDTVSFAFLQIRNGATLTVENGVTLSVGALFVREGCALAAEEGAKLNILDTSENYGTITVGGEMNVAIAAGSDGFHNHGAITVSGALDTFDCDFYNHNDAQLKLDGTMTLTDDEETDWWVPWLWNEGEVLVNGALNLTDGSSAENNVWFDESGIHFSRFAVSGTVDIAEGAELWNYVYVFFEGDGRIDNSGKVHLIQAQDVDEQTGEIGGLDLSVPEQIVGGEVMFYVLLADDDGFAAAVSQNLDGALPQVETCELTDDMTYCPEEREAFAFDLLRLQDYTLTLGNVALTITARVEGGSIALTDGATLTCPSDNLPYQVVGGGEWQDNGDGTSTIRALD